MESFLFVTPDVALDEIHFEEGKAVFARVFATLMELDKVSINGKVYRFAEAREIAKSMIGRPVYFDIDWKGRHKLDEEPIGKIEKTRVWKKKIQGIIKVTCPKIIEKLKNGFKFLFSVGGIAKSESIVKKAGRLISTLIGTIVEHVQMIPDGTNIFGKSKVGFPDAKMERIVEIQESVVIYPAVEIELRIECEEDRCTVEITPTEEEPKVEETVSEEEEKEVEVEVDINEDELVEEIIEDDIIQRSIFG